MKGTAAIVLLAIAGSAGSARAQSDWTADRWFRPGTLMLTAEVGGSAFTDFERSRARPVDEVAALGDFGRRVSARTSGTVGAWASYWFARTWGLRAGVSFSPSRFRVWNDEEAQAALDTLAPDADEPSYASLGIRTATAAAVYRVPGSLGPVMPYGMLGGGLAWYDAGERDQLPPEARTAFANGHLRQGIILAGLGAAIPLQRGNLLMTVELTDQIGRAPLGDGGAGEFFELAGIPMQIDPDQAASGGNEVGITHHLRLAFGLTLAVRLPGSGSDAGSPHALPLRGW